MFFIKTTSISARDSGKNPRITSYYRQKTFVIMFPTIIWSRIVIWFIFHRRRRRITLSFPFKEYPPGRDYLKKVLINEELSISCHIPKYFSHSSLLKRNPKSSIKQSVKECWVRLGSSTWNVLWFWNNNERRFRSLEKIIEESNLEVYRRIHDKPNEAEN